MNKKAKSTCINLAKFVVAGVILGSILYRLGAEGRAGLVESIKSADLMYLLGAVLILFCILGQGILRWHLLLKSQGIQIPLSRVAWLSAVGMFFNAFLIGAMGGDV